MLRKAENWRSAPLPDAITSVAATPETCAKLRHDVVGRLVTRGRLFAIHAAAAEEIRMIAEAVGRGMTPTAQSTDWVGGRRDLRAPRDFIDRMTAEARRKWEYRYVPWTREMARMADAGFAGPQRLRLVLDIVVDNCGLRIAERRHGLRNGTALGYLADGLERYDGWCCRARRGQV